MTGRRRRRHATVSVTIGATIGGLLLVAAACGSDESGATVDIAAATAAAVDVRSSGCGPRLGFGSGTVVGNGVILTAAHIVAGSEAIEVFSADDRSSAASVIHFDPDLDIAVLRPDDPIGAPLPLRDEAETGESGVIVILRAPDGRGEAASAETEIHVRDIEVVRTVDVATSDIYREDDVIRPGFEVDAVIEPGDSGSVVVLPGGGAGLLWARSSVRSGRAWGVDVPPDLPLTDPDAGPVDVGACAP